MGMHNTAETVILHGTPGMIPHCNSSSSGSRVVVVVVAAAAAAAGVSTGLLLVL
jgi:hypothetical protein